MKLPRIRGPRRLVTRLSVSFVALFVVVFVIVTALTLYYAQRTFQTSIDDSLVGLAETVDERLNQTDARPEKVVEELSSAAQFIELTDANGKVVTRSSNLLQRPLPVATRSLSAGRVRFRTSRFQNSDVRLIYYPLSSSGENPSPGFVVAASPVDTVQDSFSSLVVVVTIAGIFGVVVAGAGTVWLARRESQPLQKLAEQVQETAASGFRQQIPAAAAGSMEVSELQGAISNLIERQREVITRERAFFADSSHVLRTPLAVVRGDIELLEQGVYGKERLEIIAQARTAIDTMSRAINGLLLLARDPEEGGGSSWEVLSLSDLIMRLAAETSVTAPELAVRAEVEPGLDIAGDAVQLQDLFTSLLENARHYTPAGGAITISARTAEGYAVVDVSDTGIGLSPSDTAHALERFYRGPQARRMFPGGSGLGLAIAARIAGIHRGELSIQPNEAGTGTTVRVSLPLLN